MKKEKVPLEVLKEQDHVPTTRVKADLEKAKRLLYEQTVERIDLKGGMTPSMYLRLAVVEQSIVLNTKFADVLQQLIEYRESLNKK